MNEALGEQPHELHYKEILKPLFTNLHQVSGFEYASTLVRVGGMADAGWDAVEESSEFLEDLSALTQPEAQLGKVRDPEKTKWRLRLVSYAHLIEMDAPYELLANLLRVRLGARYSSVPFQAIGRDGSKKGKEKKKSKPKLLGLEIPPNPSQKIGLIKELSQAAGVPQVGLAFDEFYYPPLRNAIDHSDYVLRQNELRLLKGFIPDSLGSRAFTPVIPLNRLKDIFARAIVFYRALFEFTHKARAGFGDFKGECVRGEFFPGQRELKGLLEFLIDGSELLCGWKIHWPNQLDSIYQRTIDGCEATNMFNATDGTVEFFPGECFAEHVAFSPLVPLGGVPQYTLADGGRQPAVWDDAPNCIVVRSTIS